MIFLPQPYRRRRRPVWAALLLGGCLLLGAQPAGAQDPVTVPTNDPVTLPPVTQPVTPTPPVLIDPNPTPPPPIDASLPGAPAVDPYNQKNDGTIAGNNSQCDQSLQEAYDQGRQAALTAQLFRDSEAFKYAVSGAYAAQCVDKTYQYLSQLADVVANAQTLVTAASPVQAAITFAAHQLLKALMQQIIQQLNSQICQVTHEIMGAASSFLQNAICLPSGSFNAAFNFNIPALTLPRADSCNGFAISPVGLADLYPSSYGPGGVLTSPSLTGTPLFRGQPVSGVGQYRMNMSGPPRFRFDDLETNSDSGGYIGFDDAPPVSESAYTGPACGGAGVQGLLSKLAARESSGRVSVVNPWGYMGLYQFGCAALFTAGCINNGCSNSAHQPTTTYKWTGCGGSEAAFRSNAAVQNQAMGKFMPVVWKSIVSAMPGGRAAISNALGKQVRVQTYTKAGKNEKGRYICAPGKIITSTITQSGLLAAAHLRGQGSAARCADAAIKGGVCDGKDGTCTSVGEYMNLGGGFDVSAYTGGTCK